MTSPRGVATRAALLLSLALVLFGIVLGASAGTSSAAAAPVPAQLAAHIAAPLALPVVPSGSPTSAATGPSAPKAPTTPTSPAAPATSGTDGGVTVKVGGGKPSQSVSILLLITVLGVAPSLLLLCTSFTKIFIVLSLTRNALGLQSVPPNQVLAGLSLFLSVFVMGPVLSKVNNLGIQPFINGTKTRSVAWADGSKPLRDFMLEHTRPQEIALMLRAGNMPNPHDKAALDLSTIVPAFVLSELRSAMIIGFVVFIPFVIIDLVVSSSLMSLGMMMLPPVSVSLPFKLLLFVLVDGWGLIITSLVQSYRSG